MLTESERRKKEFELTHLSNALHTTHQIIITIVAIAIAGGGIIFTWGMQTPNPCQVNNFLTPYFSVAKYTYLLTTITQIVCLAVIVVGFRFSKKLLASIKNLEDELELEHKISDFGISQKSGDVFVYVAIGCFSFIILIFILGGLGVCS